MPRNRRFILVLLVFVTLFLSFMIYLGFERDILDINPEQLESLHKHHHHHHHHHEEADDPTMKFYTLDILNNPWTNPNYRANLYIQILLILFVDLVFLTFIYVLDKPRNYSEMEKDDIQKK